MAFKEHGDSEVVSFSIAVGFPGIPCGFALQVCHILSLCRKSLAQDIVRDTPSRQLGVSLDFDEHTVLHGVFSGIES